LACAPQRGAGKVPARRDAVKIIGNFDLSVFGRADKARNHNLILAQIFAAFGQRAQHGIRIPYPARIAHKDMHLIAGGKVIIT